MPPMRSVATVRLQTWLQVPETLPMVESAPVLKRLCDASSRNDRVSLRVADQSAPVRPRGPFWSGSWVRDEVSAPPE
jgi:hypothetical protein